MKYFRFLKNKVLDFFAGKAFLFLRWVLAKYYIHELKFLKKVLTKSDVHPILLNHPQTLFTPPKIKFSQNRTVKPIKKSVVYTCITNGYDKLISPVFLNPNMDYLIFTDDPSLSVSGWKTVFLENINNFDFARLSRLPKILPHRFLPDYDSSIYVDGNTEVLGDFSILLNLLNNQKIAGFIHPDSRNCLYQEGAEVIKLGLDKEEVVLNQMEFYRQEGFPENLGLFECRVLVRKHYDQKVMEAMELWWKQVLEFSHRDQLSFTYSLWKTKLEILPINVDSRDNELFRVKPHCKL